MGDENPIRTLRDYSKPCHKGYRNTIELPIRNNVVPLRSDTIRLVQNGCSFQGLRSEDPNQHLKDFLKLVDSVDLDGENKKRTRLSSKGNNIKLAIRNEKSKVVCATCKQCLIAANHDECVFKYVNGINPSKKNQSANVSKSANQKKHKAIVKKSKKLASEERLHLGLSNLELALGGYQLEESLTFVENTSSNTESESDTSVCDNASDSNPEEPTSKGFPNSTSYLGRFTRLQR
ncbi:hypothetical protein Tco_0602481 [Tanacetum coccineum]